MAAEALGLIPFTSTVAVSETGVPSLVAVGAAASVVVVGVSDAHAFTNRFASIEPSPEAQSYPAAAA